MYTRLYINEDWIDVNLRNVFNSICIFCNKSSHWNCFFFIKLSILSGHAIANLPSEVFGWIEFCKQWFDCGKVMHKQLSQAKLSLDFSLVIDPVYMQLSLFPSSFDAKRSRATLNLKLITSTDFSAVMQTHSGAQSQSLE